MPHGIAGEFVISQTATRTTTSRLSTPPRRLSALPVPFKTSLYRKKTRRRVLRVSLVAGNVLLFAAVAYLVIGRPSPSAATPVPQLNSSAGSVAPVGALDQLASARIAETAARMAGIGEVIPITNQADSEQALMSQASVANDTLALKPQVVASDFKSNKDIKTYVVQPGDTIAKIADKFNVTSDSIRSSNGLSGNGVKTGTKLRIPPVDGMVYKVKKGDTPGSLANKYNISKAKIIQFNDAELKGLKVGDLIILPGADAVHHSSPSVASSILFRTPSYGYNGYDYGYCTWWVADLRAKAGNPLPAGLGNASSWPYWAKAFGLAHGSTPQVGAAVVTSTSGEGHVAYVTAVKGPNTVVVSEMNHRGWNLTDTRTLTGNFFYIY